MQKKMSGPLIKDWKDKLYLFDEERQAYVPLKIDYSNAVPMLHGSTRVERKQAKRDNELGVIVSLIKQPPNAAGWMQLATITSNYPRINVMAVVSPMLDHRGVGDVGNGPDQAFIDGIKFLNYNGVRVIGYLDTKAATKPISDCKAEITRWTAWYRDAGVSGIYIDRMSLGDDIQYYQEIDAWAKDEDHNLQITIGNVATAHPIGTALNSEKILKDTGIDIFVIYDHAGYPNDPVYYDLRKEFVSKHKRSRFAFIVTSVPETNQFLCQNFIDKCVGIEKAAGYVSVNTAIAADDTRGFNEYDMLSPLFETSIHQLDRIAQAEGIGFSKGVVPDKKRVSLMADTSKLAGRTVAARATTATATIPSADAVETQVMSATTSTMSVKSAENQTGIPPEEIVTDKFGVRMIYPSTSTKAEEYFDSGNEVTSERSYLNCEMTGYFRFYHLQPDNEILLIEQLVRNANYGTQILSSGLAHCTKNRSQTKRGITAITNDLSGNRWIGVKMMTYNHRTADPRTNKQYDAVTIEIWVDDKVSDAQGNLFVKNAWRPMMSVDDGGGWFSDLSAYKDSTKGKKNTRKKDKPTELDDTILSKQPGQVMWRIFAGENESQPSDAKFLSVREITVPGRD